MARYQQWVSLPSEEKRKVLLEIDQDFRSLPTTEQDKVLQVFARLGKPQVAQFQALHNYKVKEAFRTEGSWAKVVAYMAIGWLTIHLAFVALRGAVLYVAVGRFLPVSGLRGWLML
jgi:hypothetical protein